MLNTQGAHSTSPVLTGWHSGVGQTDEPAADANEDATHAGMALNAMGSHGAYLQGNDIYYDARGTEFAQGAVQSVLDTLGTRWMADRLEQARREQAAHLRLRHHAAGRGTEPRWTRAAALVSTAVGAGLSGAFNFGAFAVVVGQVAAAMNHSPAGFGMTSAGNFSGTSAGRAVVANLVGAVPGSLTYAACAGLSATAIRPLVDAVALLVSGGRVTPLVPVDPAVFFPTPSPVGEGGLAKNGQVYTAELQANARQRADMVRRQAAMLDVGDVFNLKYGTPMFAVCHALRLMALTALQAQGTGFAAASGSVLSGGASGVASVGLAAAGGAERAGRSMPSSSGQDLPLFVPARALRRIRGDAEPTVIDAARRGFAGAGAAYVRDTGLPRKLLLGLPATALAVWVATAPINTLVPLATWSGSALRGHPAGAIVAAGSITLAAFAMAYTVLGRSLSWANRVVRADLAAQQEKRMAEAFSQSLHNFARRWPQQHSLPSGEWSVAHLAVLFDDMNRLVMEDLELAVVEGRNRHLDPGADRRLRDAYLAHSARMRQVLVAAEGAESTAPAVRTRDQCALLESLRAEMEGLQVRVDSAAVPPLAGPVDTADEIGETFF